MLLETPEEAEIVHLVHGPPADDGPPPYVLHQIYQAGHHFEAVGVLNEAATHSNVGTNSAVRVVPDAVARFLSRCHLKENKDVGHTAVAVLLLLTTITVMLVADNKALEVKNAAYETLAMNSVGFMMIYFTIRLPNKPTSTFYSFHRSIEVMGIGISLFLFLVSLLMYINIVSTSSADNLIIAIIFLFCAFGIELIVLILLIWNFRWDENIARRSGGAAANIADE